MKWLAVLLVCAQAFSSRAVPLPIQQASCNDPVIFEAVDVTLRKFNAEKGGNQFALDRITEAGTRGQHHHVTFEIKESSCATHNGRVWQDCQFLEGKATGTCRAEVYINKEEKLTNVVSHECLIAPESCPGCPFPLWSDSEELHPILEKVTQLFGGRYHHKVAKVMKASKQIVAGVKYAITYTYTETNCSRKEFPEIGPHCTGQGIFTRCKVDLHVLPNGSFGEIQMGCVPPALCIGCLEPVNSNSEELQPILKHAIEKFNSESNQQNHFQVEYANKASKQVVAGTNYYIEFTIRETDCAKDKVPALNPDCKMHQLSGTCKAEVHTSLKGEIAEIKQDCQLQVPPTLPPPVLPCLGCPMPIDAKSQEITHLLLHAINKFNSESNHPFLYKVDDIEEATQQVVSGMKYAVVFSIRCTNCSKETNEHLHDGCHGDENSDWKRCRASTRIAPREKQVDFVQVNCTLPLIEVASFPGLNPFRSLSIVEHTDGGSPGQGKGHGKGRGHGPGHGHGHGHGPKHGDKCDHQHGKSKKKDKKCKQDGHQDSSEESHEHQTRTPVHSMPAVMHPVPKPTLEAVSNKPPVLPSVHRPVEASTDGQVRPGPVPVIPIVPAATPVQGLLPILPSDSLPDLPEPPAPMCPGEPWKPKMQISLRSLIRQAMLTEEGKNILAVDEESSAN
ncbi:T-kininogen 2-like [Ambystoma mexicanum]|uniref:T-kininogen 2-like n=1 Tax=Ambystoma mexicanum TaxID=8296 RepID=UPI0037E76E03